MKKIIQKHVKTSWLLLALLMGICGSLTAQVQMNQSWNWTYPGPRFCNKEAGRIMSYYFWNNTQDTVEIIQIGVNITDTAHSIDSAIFISANSGQIIASKKTAGTKDSFAMNLQILPWQSTYVDLIVLTKQLPVNVGYLFKTTDFDWRPINTASVNKTSFNSAISVVIEDCSPKFTLETYSPYNTQTACKNDERYAQINLQSTISGIKTIEWYLNDSLVKTVTGSKYSSSPFGSMIPLSFPTTKIKALLTDMDGRIAQDSFIFDVKQNPLIKITLSKKTICSGEIAALIIDSTGLSLWEFGTFGNQDSVSEFAISSGGIYSLSVTGKNGCKTDTFVNIVEYPSPIKPVITFNEWIARATLQSDSFVWYWDSIPSPSMLPNSNSIFINGQKSGYYQVKSINQYGCASVSDIEYYEGWVAPDSIPKVKLLLSSPKPGLSVCRNDSVLASRNIQKALAPLVYEKWYLNGALIPFSPGQLFDDMWFKIPLKTSKVKLLVEIKDTLGFVGRDSIELEVFSISRTNLHLSNASFCEGTQAIAVATKGGGLKSWTWDNWNHNDSIVMTSSGVHTYSVVDTNGCRSDTVFSVSMMQKPQRPNILIQDTMLWCDRQANMYEWYSGVDQQLFAGGQYTYVKKSGVYGLRTVDNNGCKSDMSYVIFNYIEPLISNPTVKLVISGDNKAVYCIDAVDVIQTSLLLDQISKQDILSVSWFINGQFANYCSAGLCDLSKVPLKLVNGKNDIFVQVVLKSGQIKTDAVTINALKMPKPKLSINTSNFCKNSSVEFSLLDSSNAYWPVVNLSSSKINFKLTEEIKVYAIVTNSGCTAHSDTAVINPTEIPTPTLANMNCELFATVGPDQDGLFEWWSDSLLTSGTEKTYTVKQTGFYQTRYIDNASGCISDFSEPKFVEACKKTTNTKTKELTEIRVYPNPFTENLNVEIPIDCSIIIVDMVGKKVFESSEKNLHLQLPAGCYILQILRNSQIIGQEKIVRQ